VTNPDPEVGSGGMLPKAALNRSDRRDLPIRIGSSVVGQHCHTQRA
jgi:hypothetical protein